jgi:hypothetical protein
MNLKRVLLIVMFAAASRGDDLVTVTMPLKCSMPASAAQSWNQFQAASGEPDRLDVFSRENRSWRLIASHPFSPKGGRLPALHCDGPIGLLWRQPGAADYQWAETTCDHADTASFHRFRSIRVAAGKEPSVIVIFSGSDEPVSRRVEGSSAVTFEFLKPEAAIVCRSTPSGDACAVAAPNVSDVSLPSGSKHVRVFQLPSADAKVEPRILARGTSILRPRQITSAVLRAQQWIALSLDADDWSSVVVDWSTLRTVGAELPLPPQFTAVHIPPPDEVAVRPMIEDQPVQTAPTDLLLFIPQNGPAIPLARAMPDADGTFRPAALTAGDYSLKLISSETSAHEVAATLRAHEITSVRFERGSAVRGRVVLQGTGASQTLPLVHVIWRQPLDVKAPAQAPDLADGVREANVTANGAFTIALSHTGRYELEAVWGAAHVTREFTLRKENDVVDLGDIGLGSGSILRGRLEGCAGGEINLAPIPDLEKPIAPSFFTLLRATVGADESFYVEGVTAGPWVVGAKCRGAALAVEPTVIHLADVPDTSIALRAVKPSS